MIPKDLVVLTADKNWEAALNGLFTRGCRQSNLVQIAMARIWQMAR